MIKFQITAGTLRRIAWRQDGAELIICTQLGHAFARSIWSVAGAQVASSFLGRARGPVPSFSAHHIATVDDNRIHLRQLTGEELYEIHLEPHENVSLAALSADGTWLAAVRPWPGYEFESVIHVYRLHALGAVQYGTLYAFGRVHDAVFDPTQRYLLASSDIGFTIWDLAKQESVCVQSQPGLRLAVWSADSKSLYLRRTAQLECRSAFDGRLQWVQPLAPSDHADDQLITLSAGTLAASAGDTVLLLAATVGKVTAAYDWQIGRIVTLAKAPNALTVAAGSAAGQVVIWDID